MNLAATLFASDCDSYRFPSDANASSFSRVPRAAASASTSATVIPLGVTVGRMTTAAGAPLVVSSAMLFTSLRSIADSARFIYVIGRTLEGLRSDPLAERRCGANCIDQRIHKLACLPILEEEKGGILDEVDRHIAVLVRCYLEDRTTPVILFIPVGVFVHRDIHLCPLSGIENDDGHLWFARGARNRGGVSLTRRHRGDPPGASARWRLTPLVRIPSGGTGRRSPGLIRCNVHTPNCTAILPFMQVVRGSITAILSLIVRYFFQQIQRVTWNETVTHYSDPILDRPDFFQR